MGKLTCGIPTSEMFHEMKIQFLLKYKVLKSLYSTHMNQATLKEVHLKQESNR